MEPEEEELLPPARPQRITRHMRSGDMLKLQRETSKAKPLALASAAERARGPGGGVRDSSGPSGPGKGKEKDSLAAMTSSSLFFLPPKVV